MKRLLAVILVAAMLMTMVVMPASAWSGEEQAENITLATEQCPCGCGLQVDAVQWKPWDVNVNGAPAAGHYYLPEDYQQTQQHTIMAGDHVVIDLRGKTLTTTNYGRLFLVYGNLYVMDSVGGGRMCSKTSGGAYGGVVMVAMNETADPTFALHSGTLTVDSDNKSSRNGGLISVGAGCHFKMYGGMILGGSTTERGGAIHANSIRSNVEILGGSIINCSADVSGGAIFSYGTTTLKNCRISGGIAKLSGGNIYQEGGSLTVENAVIEHGIANATDNGGGNIFVQGGCQVSIKNSTIRNGYAAANGGNLYLGKGTQRLENVNISSGVAAGKGANLYQTGEASVTIVGGQIADVVGSTCPHCKQTVTWTEAGETLSGHCYLTGAKNITAAYTITGDVVLDLRGNNITSSERAFKIEAGATLTVLDTVGGATVKGSGVANEAGGVIYNEGTLNIYGGNYIYTAGKTVTSGGVIYTTGNTNIHGGMFDGSAFSNTATTALGGVLHMSDGAKTFTMTAGHALGAKIYAGSTFCFGQKNTVNITGGSFLGGTATNSGANLRFNGASGSIGDATIQNALISGGDATTSAGTLYLNYFNASMENCLVRDGKTSGYGGNISLGTRASLDVTDCFISGGTASRGGNLYAASYLSGATFTDCTITGGQATATTGGNILINHGNIRINGGEISHGTAKTSGGNVYTNGGNYDHNDAKDDGFHVYASQKGKPIITTGKAGTTGGNIYTCGITVLDAAFISNGSATTKGKDIYYANGSVAYNLTVGAGLTGNISLGVSDANFTGSEVVNTTAVDFAGKLFLENKDGQSITVMDGKLVLGNIAVVATDGKTQWVMDMAAAQAAYEEGGYIQIFADTAMTLTKDCAVDLNGKTLTVTGDYTLYGMDSSGDDYTVGTGKAILNGNTKTDIHTTVYDGREYIAIVEGDTATYHRLGMRLTDVTLRPSSCGVYYKASWDCDSQLAALVDVYGIALSVYNQPDENFRNDKNVVKVDYDGADFVSGEKKTGVAINNIMKKDLSSVSNQARGQMPIYASAYLQLTDGTKLMSRNADYSLKTAMELLDNMISEDPTHYRRHTSNARAFYETWKKNGMNNWSFTNIPTPEEDDVIDILMIGSSFCYYYVEELYGLAEAAGVKMRVCNVYYSGCTMNQHYNWWIGNESKYQFFVTDGNGRKQYSNVSLEYCLAQGDWDVISLQESSSAIRKVGLEAYLANTAVYTDALIPYLKSEFPNAVFYWHQPWAYQIGYDRNGYQMTSREQQTQDTQTQKELALAICEKYDVPRVNTGEAWQIIREGGYDNLCARLAVGNGVGDYYHDGDIGGGQYLNACVWFEILTGQSCIGNTYRPNYALKESLIPTLQEAAHQAVENLNAEQH